PPGRPLRPSAPEVSSRRNEPGPRGALDPRRIAPARGPAAERGGRPEAAPEGREGREGVDIGLSAYGAAVVGAPGGWCGDGKTVNAPLPLRRGAFKRNSGGDLLSQGVFPQVPSALAGLTTVFGMGTGVTPPP